MPRSIRLALHLWAAAGLAVACVGLAVAQSWPQHTLWTESPLRLNPASGANLYSLDASASYRRQWVGLEGAPSTTQAAVGAPLYIVGGGASLGFEYDEVGAHEQSLVRGALSYGVYDRDDWRVSVGAGVTYRSVRLDGSRLRTADGEYVDQLNHFDDLLPVAGVSGSALGVDLGVEATWRETTFGVSFLDANGPVSQLDEGPGRRYAPTVLAYGMSVLPVAELIDLEGSALVQTDGATWQTQLGARAWYDRNIALGAALRGYSGATLDAVSLLVSWRPSPGLTFGYAYDYGLSTLQQVHDGSHEVVIRYVMRDPIGKGQLPPAIYNPRP